MQQRLRYGLFFLFFISCTLYPRYERPHIASAPSWREPLAVTEEDLSWWDRFSDPVLKELIQEALVSNQDILTAIARVDQFKAEWGVVKSKLYPQLEADVTAKRQQATGALKTSSLHPTFNTFETLFNASYFADIWGEVRSSSESAYHEWLASIEARKAVVLAVVTSVAISYMELRKFDEQLEISKATLQSRETALHLARIRFELGLTSQLEVEQAITEVEVALVQVERFEIAVAETENLLSVFLGKYSEAIARGKTLSNMVMPKAIFSYTPADIICQRPDILAAEHNLIAANARIGNARAQFFPQITLVGLFGSQSSWVSQFFTNPAKIFEYGADILQEIFTGGRLTSGLELAEAEKRALLHTYLQTILVAFQEANDAMVDHKLYLEMVETQRKRVEATKLYLYLSTLRYEEGEVDYLTFLDAERQYFQAELDAMETVGNSFVSFIQIYQALGGPWVDAADAAATSSDPPSSPVSEEKEGESTPRESCM